MHGQMDACVHGCSCSGAVIMWFNIGASEIYHLSGRHASMDGSTDAGWSQPLLLQPPRRRGGGRPASVCAASRPAGQARHDSVRSGWLRSAARARGAVNHVALRLAGKRHGARARCVTRSFRLHANRGADRSCRI